MQRWLVQSHFKGQIYGKLKITLTDTAYLKNKVVFYVNTKD